MQLEIESALISISHLAERLSLSRRTIHRLIAKGELPTLKVGRRRLVRLSDLRHWLAGHETLTPGGNASNINRQFAPR